MAQVVADLPATDEAGSVEAAAPNTSARDSILGRVRAAAKDARTNRTFDLPLPTSVGEGIGLRLGVPRTADRTIANDMMDDEPDIEGDLRFLAHNIVGVVANDGGKWELVEGMTVQDLASTYGQVLRGADTVISDEAEAVRELHCSGTPPQVEPQLVSAAARLYRMWATNDPTLGLS